MIITRDKMVALLDMLVLTRDEEATCDDCLNRLAEFAETTLAGKSVPDGLRSIDEHLERCGECREEFSALKLALSGEDFQDRVLSGLH